MRTIPATTITSKKPFPNHSRTATIWTNPSARSLLARVSGNRLRISLNAVLTQCVYPLSIALSLSLYRTADRPTNTARGVCTMHEAAAFLSPPLSHTQLQRIWESRAPLAYRQLRYGLGEGKVTRNSCSRIQGVCISNRQQSRRNVFSPRW